MHVLDCAKGRLGANVMPKLAQAIADGHGELSTEARAELKALATLLQRARWRDTPLVGHSKTVTVISDAMWKPPGTARLCYIIVTDDGTAFGHWIDIPVDFWGHCLPRKTQIAMAELVALVIAIGSHPDLFREVAATFYIDNVVAQCALVRGASKRPTCH